MNNLELWQWVLLIGSSVLMFVFSPFTHSKFAFFKAHSDKIKTPSVFILTSSLVMSWIFSKSITNASNLGLTYGIWGGLAYATYYLSFLTAGIIIYKIRTKGKFESIHHFLKTKFGKSAVILFSILIGFRLFNEVWSNTMVIGFYFGKTGSVPYYLSIITFTILTLAYVLKGGLKSSLITDMIQMIFFSVLLFIVLNKIFPASFHQNISLFSNKNWGINDAINLLFVALIQIFSYPFHDPVLTDRAFISSPKKTLISFILATVLGFVFIFAFSLIGVYAKTNNMVGQAAVAVSQSFGAISLLMMNFIMITSAASTLDSTFASFSKLVVVDLGKQKYISINKGRMAMIFIALLGILPVFINPQILSATTISGTMVIGLAPIFIFWNKKVPKQTFNIVIGIGVFFGIIFAFGWFPKKLIFIQGNYGDLLSINIIGTVFCFLVFYILSLIRYEKG